ncbi:uncharacterized protein PITG_08940 [Phytophthora infestans T30-4]|uniref:Uncharacterized protein n=1 Tax=Phytophthora infestans (strain T30-4) TaxID=403677 RepID=D0NDJ6_PHYIT|nr:uncharacterized protein PITG_08940 [Phytophthora infestans T30-4]EEY56153.1 conserved hypothetical protein [Phytophthora infestans T30-4]|eukprot:XP_002902983.1 conserved hypothetical protein [Phytophthora infestans T30-4]
MTDDEFPAQFELISSPGGDGQDDDSERDFVSDPGSSSVDDDGDDDFEPPTDSSDSSDTLQELLNEIDEEREDADVENVQLDLQDPNTDRTPRVRRTESYPERVALSPAHSDREKTQLKKGKLKSGESFYATGGFGEARNIPANTQHSAKGSEEHVCG